MKWMLIGGIAVITLSACAGFLGCDQLKDAKDVADAASKFMKGIPDEVGDYLDADDIARLEGEGFDINKGDNPPSVEGDFYLNSLQVIKDDFGAEGMEIENYTWSYDKQAGDSLEGSYEMDGGADSASGVRGNISGDGDCFTVYLNFTGNTNGCDYSMPFVQSGCLTEEGIEDFEIAYVMQSKSGSNCELLMPENSDRITSEMDGMGERK
jgi:hypothetical protein